MNIPTRSLRYVRCLLAAAMLAAAAASPARAAQTIDTTVAGAAAATAAERAAIAALGFSADDPVSVAAYREEIQSNPYQPFDAGGYVADPAFNHGQYFEDNFAMGSFNPTAYFLGRKVARLSNGDLVVAALVKNPGGNQTNGYWNIGLIKYDATGSARQIWSNAGSNGLFGNQYLVYPKSDTATYTRIQDIKIIDDFILVAADSIAQDGSNVATVAVYDADGGFRSSVSPGAFTGKNVYNGGIEVYKIGTQRHVFVATTRTPLSGNTTPRPFYDHWTLGDNGGINYVSGQTNVTLAYGVCSGANENCQAKAIALGTSAIVGNAPVIFVAVDKPAPNANTTGDDIVVLGINPDGTPLSNWQAGWWDIGGNGGDKNDVPFGIAVKSTGVGLPGSPRVHTVYVAANSSRQCAAGISVLRQSTSDGGASAHSTLFGGSAATGTLCVSLRPANDIGNGATMQDGKLAIVGMRVTPPLIPTSTSEDKYDGEFALVDDLTIAAPLTTYPFQIGAPRSKHTGLYGIVGIGNGKFVVTGDDRFPNDDSVSVYDRGKQEVVTAGLMPDDVIFKNGFD